MDHLLSLLHHTRFLTQTYQFSTNLPRAPLAATAGLFEHVAEYARFYRAMLKPGGIPRFGELVRAEVERQFTLLLPVVGMSEEQTGVPITRYTIATG